MGETGQQAALAKDQAYRAGHLPVDTSGRTERRSFVCGHCGVGMRWEHGRFRGTMAEERSRCFPQHNHVTRDIKPEGQCPACDEIHRQSSGR